MLKTVPAVFAVDKSYQIMVQLQCEALVSIQIGNKTYYDDSNGIMNSLSPIHRVCVPMEVLDQEKQYTVCVRPIVERKPYFTETKEPLVYRFAFAPVPEKNIRVYHISDAHNAIDMPVKAAKVFGKIDLLILNGDVIDHSGDPEKFTNIYEICAQLTDGRIPVVFSRGNHDMRGNFAEKFADYTPSHHGNTYYTFRLGSIWGLLLDCGEDKTDDHPEYGFTVACHAFRERQTEFLKTIIEDAEKEYGAEGVKTRIVIAHNPFTQQLQSPFDIEEDIYRQWASLLKTYVRPDLMICGHTHKYGIHKAGGEYDHLGQPCTVVIASEPQKERFIGCGFVIGDNQIEAVFTDSLGATLSRETIPKRSQPTYLFDFDGTLVDSMPSYISAMLRILDENNIAYAKDIIKVITPLGFNGTAEYYINDLGLNMPKDKLILQMKEYMLEAYFYTIPAKSNVISVLKELKKRGASLNILTASPHITLDACLKRLGIWDVFDNVWSCDDFGTTKADPEIYRMTAERMNVTVDSVLFLDDNLNADVTAKSAGMQVCGVYDASSGEYIDQIKSIADYYICDFVELLNI